MSKKFALLILFGIIVLGAVLRLWQLGSIPASPDWDEAALGYNAYSILQTGKDEHGKLLPVVIKSFGDYKPALYAYLAIPSIKLLGLNVLAVRLPSAVFGILTVLAVFFLTKELFRKNNLALLSSLLLAISPWHIQFSRVAFEASVGLALNTFGVLFFLKALKKPWFLLFSALTFGLSLHVYQSEKVFVPLLIAILVFAFRREFSSIGKKYIYTSLVIFAIILLPLMVFILGNGEALSRAKSVSVFSNASIIEQATKKTIRDHMNNDVLGLVLDNRRVEYVKHVIGGYLSHFDLNWLFITGDIARHHAPGMGLMYLIELPFLLIGVYALIFGNLNKSVKIFMVLWLLIVPIPASVTNDVPHAVRAINFLPVLQVFTAIGLLQVFNWALNMKNSIFKIRIGYIILFLISIFGFLNLSYYLNQYFVQQNYYFAKDWQYGYKDMVNYVTSVEKNYNKIIVSNTGTMDQSYIFFLFYLKYDPAKYLTERETIGANNGIYKFANYEFRKLNFNEENEKNILIVGTSSDIPDEIKEIYEVKNPDNSLAIKVVEKNK